MYSNDYTTVKTITNPIYCNLRIIKNYTNTDDQTKMCKRMLREMSNYKI